MRVAIYTRVGRVLQTEQYAPIEEQILQIKAWADSNMRDIVTIIEDVRIQVGDHRPKLEFLIEEALSAHRPYDAIVVHDSSRLYRNILDTAVLIKRLTEAGVALLILDQAKKHDVMPLIATLDCSLERIRSRAK